MPNYNFIGKDKNGKSYFLSKDGGIAASTEWFSGTRHQADIEADRRLNLFNQNNSHRAINRVYINQEPT